MSILGIDIPEEAVCLFSEPIAKHDMLAQLAHAVASTGAITNEENFVKALFDREQVMSTGIGSGVAIPHVRIEEVTRPALGVGISKTGVEYDTLDNDPVYVVVLFAMPAGSHKEYLKLLAEVMMQLKAPGFTEELRACTTAKQIISLMTEGV